MIARALLRIAAVSGALLAVAVACSDPYASPASPDPDASPFASFDADVPAPGDAAVTPAPVDADADAGPPAPTSTYAKAVLADGPIAYWRMGIDGGRIVPDETGNGLDLLLKGNPATLAGGATADGDHAIQFDGVNSYGQSDLGARSPFLATHDFTVECWTASTAEPFDGTLVTTEQVVTDAGDSTGLLVVASKGTLSAVRRRVDGTESVAKNVAPLVYHHVIVTYGGGALNIVLDGNLKSVTSTAPLSAPTRVVFVGRSGIGGFFFAGRIDEVAIYDRALSYDRAKAHLQAASMP